MTTRLYFACCPLHARQLIPALNVTKNSAKKSYPRPPAWPHTDRISPHAKDAGSSCGLLSGGEHAGPPASSAGLGNSAGLPRRALRCDSEVQRLLEISRCTGGWWTQRLEAVKSPLQFRERRRTFRAASLNSELACAGRRWLHRGLKQQKIEATPPRPSLFTFAPPTPVPGAGRDHLRVPLRGRRCLLLPAALHCGHNAARAAGSRNESRTRQARSAKQNATIRDATYLAAPAWRHRAISPISLDILPPMPPTPIEITQQNQKKPERNRPWPSNPTSKSPAKPK